MHDIVCSSYFDPPHLVYLQKLFLENSEFLRKIMSGSKWLADKALAQLRNAPRITIPALNEVGRKPVSFYLENYLPKPKIFGIFF